MRKELNKHVRRDIEQCGRSIIAVPEGYGFAYTIGNHAAGLPELLVIGVAQRAGFLNDLSQQMIVRGTTFEDGQLVDLGGRLPVKVIRAGNAARAEYTIQAGQYFGIEDYAVMQVLIPDRNGKFPGEPDCTPPCSLIPVLALN
jgi:hypothetical protein